MRSRVFVKCLEWCGYFYESAMEWFYSIVEKITPHRTSGHNLTEEYTIHELYANKPFVRDFIEQRIQKAITGKYSIKIRCEPQNKEKEERNVDNTTAIGSVKLMRKNKLIDRATLVIKNKENNLIYWNFNK